MSSYQVAWASGTGWRRRVHVASFPDALHQDRINAVIRTPAAPSKETRQPEATMFTAEHLRSLVRVRPFVPFRLIQSDGSAIEVRGPEVLIVGRHFAVIGLLDPEAQ